VLRNITVTPKTIEQCFPVQFSPQCLSPPKMSHDLSPSSPSVRESVNELMCWKFDCGCGCWSLIANCCYYRSPWATHAGNRHLSPRNRRTFTKQQQLLPLQQATTTTTRRTAWRQMGRQQIHRSDVIHLTTSLPLADQVHTILNNTSKKLNVSIILASHSPVNW